MLDLNDPRLVQGIWKPEVSWPCENPIRHLNLKVYFPNAKTADFQYVTMPNLLLRIKPGGQIEYMLRYHTVFGQ